MAIGGEIASSFTGCTRLSKGFAAVFVSGYIISQLFPWTEDYFALIPGRTIPFAWNVLTAGYFERSFVGLISSVVGVLFFGKLLEPIWGPRGFIKFIAFVSFFTSINTFVVSIFLYYITRQGSYLYAPISGFCGVIAGFLVAVKQLMPDQEFFAIKLRPKWFPSVFVAVSATLGLFVPNAILFVPFIMLGTYVSWIYLRYIQAKSETANLKGDPSEEFAFSTFFPQFMRPVIHPVATICEKVFCGRRLHSATSVEGGNVLSNRPLPGSDPAEASRRRERGARALEERLTASDTISNDKAEENV